MSGRFTDAEKRKALEREIGMRRRVYARQVETGRMTTGDAEHGIAVMCAILDDYAEPDLFGVDPVDAGRGAQR
ncbi:MAG: hypothetical protein WBA67_14060 [Jannaschia sp.]